MSGQEPAERGENVEQLRTGDTGFVIDGNSRGERRIAATVTKVGRRWATVEPAWLGRFDKDTKLNDGGSYASSKQFYTPADLAHRDAMHEANEVLTKYGISFRLGSRWADQDALALAAWLESHFGSSVDPRPDR